MFRRRKKGKAVGPWYYRHPVTGLKVSSKTTDLKLAKQRLRDLENDAEDRSRGRYVEKWEEASGRWMELNQHLTSYDGQEDYRAFWDKHLTGMKLNAIDEEVVHQIISRFRPVSMKERRPQNATANNYVRYVAKIQRFGKVTVPDYYVYPAPKQGKGALRPEQWATWRDSMPADLRLLVTHTLSTGLRIQNVIRFEWDWLHGDRAYLPATVTKTDQAYGVPLNRSASSVIAEVKSQVVRHPKHVFTHRGKSWKYATVLEAIKRTSKAALGFQVTPHWLRHTFRSWLAQEGVSDSIARRLGCWQLGKGADSKYLHFDVEPLRKFAEVLDPLVSFSPHHPEKAQANQ